MSFSLKSYLYLNIVTLLCLYLMERVFSLTETTACSPGYFFDTTILDCRSCPSNASTDPSGKVVIF